MSNDSTTIREQLKDGKPVITFTKGVSMQPLLYEGITLVTVEPVSRSLNKNELPLCFLSDGKYVIHRIIGFDGDNYITRGDNCLTSERIARENALGVVTQINRKGKQIKVTDTKYKIYVSFWNAIYPLRKCVYIIRGKIGRSKSGR